MYENAVVEIKKKNAHNGRSESYFYKRRGYAFYGYRPYPEFYEYEKDREIQYHRYGSRQRQAEIRIIFY